MKKHIESLKQIPIGEIHDLSLLYLYEKNERDKHLVKKIEEAMRTLMKRNRVNILFQEIIFVFEFVL